MMRIWDPSRRRAFFPPGTDLAQSDGVTRASTAAQDARGAPRSRVIKNTAPGPAGFCEAASRYMRPGI